MANLPEQVYQRGTAVAVRDAANPYDLDSNDVILPRLRIAQYQSDVFKRKLADYGDLVVTIGKEDANPIVVAKGGEPMSAPLVFYVHRIGKGFNYREDPAQTNLTFGPLGGTFQQALAFTQGDSRRVFQKHDYVITIPAYEDLPVQFLMTSKWGGPAAKWMNTQIGILLQRGTSPLKTPFQVQSRPTHNDKGDFAEAIIGIAAVKAREKAQHAELVACHASIAAAATMRDGSETYEASSPDTTSAPSLG